MSIHSASARDRFLRPTFCFSLVAALLLVTAHRLPAPISEIPESPTPAPEQSAKPKPKRTIKPKAESENSERSTKRQTPSPTPSIQPRFAGTWNGTLNRGLLGNVNYTLIVNAAGTLVKEICSSCDNTAPEHPAHWDGFTITWRGGALNEVACALTPDNEGKTARVTMKGFFANGDSVFHRTSP
jgi:hypothetical protein